MGVEDEATGLGRRPEEGEIRCGAASAGPRQIGSCSDGVDYCVNPGPDCINANYGSTETCNNIDDDCVLGHAERNRSSV